MSEPEEQKTEETAEQEAPAQETEAADGSAEAADGASESAETADESQAAPIIWSQKRVPNIEKGYNPSVPFYMMGILVALVILSVIFAKITS
ncbi:MAG: hypothetical protein F4Y78_02325 [Candidatus Dadabacteria bacterium]|nr:hypothetical protein [Candidatus Dadabacteria bacterium]MYA48888.1 hypothetical protein [Candidatus Dadabacteria bacterium]MYF47965.1 hypothetical protein [Candidatus Dadabacteria bacterium]MYG82422.1 hypothetical protein [Candidatus Dadabacteria bacterium]MYK49377.1 hypothetical protein [Candidatus Dadabacteria bacterium]